jgi:hypothetical protein
VASIGGGTSSINHSETSDNPHASYIAEIPRTRLSRRPQVLGRQPSTSVREAGRRVPKEGDVTTERCRMPSRGRIRAAGSQPTYRAGLVPLHHPAFRMCNDCAAESQVAFKLLLPRVTPRRGGTFSASRRLALPRRRSRLVGPSPVGILKRRGLAWVTRWAVRLRQSGVEPICLNHQGRLPFRSANQILIFMADQPF